MKIDISNLDELDRDSILELKLLLHDNLSSMKFSIDVAKAKAEEDGCNIDLTWLTNIKYAQLKNREKLRRVTARLIVINQDIKKNNILLADLENNIIDLVKQAEDLAEEQKSSKHIHHEIQELLRRYK